MKKTIIIFLTCIFILGCKSMPEDKTRKDWLSLLPNDASFYFIIDFRESSRGIINEIAETMMEETPGMDFLLERTNVIYGAVTVTENEGALVSNIMLLGKYPRGTINSVIKDDWTKNDAPIDYWSSEENSIKICLPERYMIFFSNGDILPLIENYDSPEPFSDFSIENIDLDMFTDYEMVLVFPDFTNDGFSEKVGLSTVINQLLVSADINEDNNEVGGIFNLGKESSIASFNQVLRLMIVYILRGYRIEGLASRLKDIEINAFGDQMKVQGLFFSSEELAGLLVNMINKRTEE
jgi:hypothetical protein